MKLLKSFRRGERGFTLIELLVVVAILGILAAVVIPNVMGMMGTGRIEAANTEAHNVEIAVLAAMVQNDVFSITADQTVGPTTDLAEVTVGDYITGSLEATYTLDGDGHITGATATIGGKWDGLTYTENVGWSETTTPA